MPKFGNRSKNNLLQCDIRIQSIMNEVIKFYDCTIITGHRGKIEQNEKFSEGTSKVRYPDSTHNTIPSLAVDVAPWPIPENWGIYSFKELAKFYMLAGIILYEANKQGYTLRWGGDWNMDFNFNDNTFDDLIHYEIIN